MQKDISWEIYFIIRDQNSEKTNIIFISLAISNNTQNNNLV